MELALTTIFLLISYSYVSYRVVKALKESYSAGLFRNFANIPLLHLFFTFGAMPFLIRDKFSGRKLTESSPFIGNSDSLIFHLRGCEYEESMGQRKRRALKSVKDAEDKGYRPCLSCSPTKHEQKDHDR